MTSTADHSQAIDWLQEGCPVRAALDVIRGRWKPSILCLIKDEPKRFSELQSELSGVTAQTLSVQLRQLEADDIVTRTVFPEVPARVEYGLSEFGRTLSDVMDQLDEWGTAYLARRQKSGAIST